ncbi:hypothetical protein H4Q32_002944 [Labeo rohita]|uniref:Uncharacterized protein n=1 Tax=Labeo rohita TaxID=84645 RepID=A0ABQ8MQ23_LABRO|nr:hypothetical protein H4Q32_002944 [Labeo rohita]
MRKISVRRIFCLLDRRVLRWR